LGGVVVVVVVVVVVGEGGGGVVVVNDADDDKISIITPGHRSKPIIPPLPPAPTISLPGIFFAFGSSTPTSSTGLKLSYDVDTPCHHDHHHHHHHASESTSQ